jgi:galactose mutarotase-like enzyme
VTPIMQFRHYTHERNFGCRISDEYTYRGLRLLVLENELIRVTILLDKGTDVYEFLHKPSDTDFMWRTPRGVRAPGKSLEMVASSVGPFTDFYEGGWQECMPNGGRVCQYRGAEMGMHGEVWGLPWECQITQDDPEVVQARTWVRTVRTPFLLEKTFTLHAGSGALEISESLTNEGQEQMDLMWGHHPALGSRFIEQDCRIDTSARTVVVDENVVENCRFEAGARFNWPVGIGRSGDEVDVSVIPGPDSRLNDMLYLTDLQDEGWWAVTSQPRKLGFGISFDPATFRHIWLWMPLGGSWGSPSWGRHYTVALEPFSSIPAILCNAIEAGTQLVLEPGEQRSTWLRAVAYEGIERVGRITPEGVVHSA